MGDSAPKNKLADVTNAINNKNDPAGIKTKNVLGFPAETPTGRCTRMGLVKHKRKVKAGKGKKSTRKKDATK